MLKFCANGGLDEPIMIKRLRMSKERFVAEQRQAGALEGGEWLANDAEYWEARKLSEIDFADAADHLEFLWIWVPEEIGLEPEHLWGDGQQPEDEFVIAFVESVRETWSRISTTI